MEQQEEGVLTYPTQGAGTTWGRGPNSPGAGTELVGVGQKWGERAFRHKKGINLVKAIIPKYV